MNCELAGCTDVAGGPRFVRAAGRAIALCPNHLVAALRPGGLSTKDQKALRAAAKKKPPAEEATDAGARVEEEATEASDA